TINGADGGDKQFNQVTFTNNGTVIQSGGRVGSYYTSFNYAATGVYDFVGDGQQITDFGGNYALQNSGIIEKTSGAGTSQINLALNNVGIVSAASGTLSVNNFIAQVSRNSLTGGTWNASGSATL